MKPMVTRLTAAATLAAASFTVFAQETGPVVRLDSALDAIVPAGAKVERVATGFGFAEGPVWVRDGGFLIFSDIPDNVIRKWHPADNTVSVFLDRAGSPELIRPASAASRHMSRAASSI